MSKHQKHPPLIRPEFGEFATAEIGILGAPCGDIQRLSAQIVEQLTGLKVGYVDARHGAESSARMSGGRCELIAEPGGWVMNSGEPWNVFDVRRQMRAMDLVLVNANHFDAKSQIVVLHPDKLESLERKVQRLTNVLAFVKCGVEDIPDFVKSSVKSWQNIPLFRFAQTRELAELAASSITHPIVKGLVLAGGRSSRMGRDKGKVVYHEKVQREHMYDLLQPYCETVYMSCREDQIDELSDFNPLPDRLLNMGPFGAITSAFISDPQSAWMVVACDLPLFGKEALAQLHSERDFSSVATAFISPDSSFPEPLAAIWEPRSYSRLLQFLSQGYSCPRKVLINSEVKIVSPERAEWLRNANTPEELAMLGGK